MEKNEENHYTIFLQSISRHYTTKIQEINLPFSSDNNPLTEVSLSSSCLNFMTRSALTNQFFLNGLTISSRSTRCTSLYSWISCVVGGRYNKQSKTLGKKSFKRSSHAYIFFFQQRFLSAKVVGYKANLTAHCQNYDKYFKNSIPPPI